MESNFALESSSACVKQAGDSRRLEKQDADRHVHNAIFMFLSPVYFQNGFPIHGG